MTRHELHRRRTIEIPAQVDRTADLVLKGGVASGIVYPDAVRKLASEFHFVGVAGTSAGAIVASIAAAAEYQRRVSGSSAGYDVLAEASEELMGEGRMLELFRPDRSTEAAFGPARTFLRGVKGWRFWFSLLVRPVLALLVCLTALSLAIRFAALSDGGRVAATAVATLVSVALVTGVAVWVARSRGLHWRENGFGFCSGMARGQCRPAGTLPPLSEWLHVKIQAAAGLPLDEPLTFGQLHGAPVPEVLNLARGRAGFRSIDFRAITTCLTLARPVEFPLKRNRFGFRVEDVERVFPAAVVAHMVRASNARTERKREAKGDPNWTSERACPVAQTIPLPPSDDLPILVATRMSLSFPGLLTMVKLWTFLDHKNYGASRTGSLMEPVWFSDGGITSNLPVSRFDSPLSSRPTLAINLLYERKVDPPVRGSTRGKDVEVYLPEIADTKNPELLYPWQDDGGFRPSVAGWLMSMFTSAQVWTDNNSVLMRGSRERVVEVWLSSEEGGLNLNMKPGVLQDLINRGYRAAERLIERFADAPITDPAAPVQEDSWDQYRWVRLRASVAAISDLIRDFAETFDQAGPPDRPWRAFFEMDRDQLANYKPASNAQSRAMLNDLEALVELAKSWDLIPRPEDGARDASRFKKSPRPRAAFRAQGPIDG